jgi:hypothetical protein
MTSHAGPITRAFMEVAGGPAVGFHNSYGWPLLPELRKHRRMAERARCGRDTEYEPAAMGERHHPYQ